MRTAVVTLGISLIIPIGVAAQASSPQAVTPAPEQLTVTPAHPSRPRLDFGLDEAMRQLPLGPWRLVKVAPRHQLPMQPPPSTVIESPPAIDCAMVRKHTHRSTPMRTIEPPKLVEHTLKTVPVTPCPVR